MASAGLGPLAAACTFRRHEGTAEQRRPSSFEPEARRMGKFSRLLEARTGSATAAGGQVWVVGFARVGRPAEHAPLASGGWTRARDRGYCDAKPSGAWGSGQSDSAPLTARKLNIRAWPAGRRRGSRRKAAQGRRTAPVRGGGRLRERQHLMTGNGFARRAGVARRGNAARLRRGPRGAGPRSTFVLGGGASSPSIACQQRVDPGALEPRACRELPKMRNRASVQ